MPHSLPKACKRPGCSGRRVDGRCSVCGTRHARESPLRAPWRDYGREWQRAREVALGLHPICMCRLEHRHCCGNTAASIEVHHMIRLRDGGTHDQANLQPLCKACHNAHTNKEKADDRRSQT